MAIWYVDGFSSLGLIWVRIGANGQCCVFCCGFPDTDIVYKYLSS